MKNDCIFCAIIDGELPSFKIYEDEYFYVMLDRFPKCLGHTLILPKRHASNIYALNDNEGQRLFPLAQKVAGALQENIKFTGLNLLQNNGATAGQEVSHFHLHLIPRIDGDDMAIQYRRLDPPEEEFEKTAEALRKVLCP